MENKDIKKVDKSKEPVVEKDEKRIVEIDGVKVVLNKAKLGKYNRWGYLFVIPFIVVFCIFCIYPVFNTLYLSFCEYKGGVGAENAPKFLSDDLLKNYTTVWNGTSFWKALLNTAVIWTLNIILQLGLAFLLTIVFSDVKYRIRGLSVYRALYYLPNLIAATSIAYLFSTLLNTQSGSINILLNQLGYHGAPIKWLDDRSSILSYIHDGWGRLDRSTPVVGKFDFYTLPQISVAVIQSWMWFGNSFIMLMAGVMGISRDYFEAAAIDGAGRWKIFGSIVLPLLRPIMLYVGVTSLIGGLQLFDLPQLITGGNNDSPAYQSLNTAVMYIYKYGFDMKMNVKNIGVASAAAYTLFLIIMVFCVAQVLYAKRKEAK